MKTIYKRELSSYFTTIKGYFFIMLVLLGVGVAQVMFFENYSANFAYTLYKASAVFALAAPIFTMKSVANEKTTGIDKLIYSLPVKMSSVVTGKYLAMLTVLLIPTALIAVYPLALRFIDTSSSVSLLMSYSSLSAFFLLGAMWLAIGLFISSAAPNKTTAFAVSLFVAVLFWSLPVIAGLLPEESSQASLFALSALVILIVIAVYSLTKGSAATWIVFFVLELPLIIVSFVKPELFAGLFARIASTVSPFEMMSDFASGIISIKAIVAYFSVSILFTALAEYTMKERRRSFNR